MIIELAPRAGYGTDMSFKDDSVRGCVDYAEIGWEGSGAEGDRGFGRVGCEAELVEADVDLGRGGVE